MQKPKSSHSKKRLSSGKKNQRRKSQSRVNSQCDLAASSSALGETKLSYQKKKKDRKDPEQPHISSSLLSSHTHTHSLSPLFLVLSTSSTYTTMAELNALPKDPLLSQGQKDVLAGTFGGIAQVLVGQPLDILKVRLQTSPPGTYTGMLDCATRIVRNEGPFAFYKGTLTPLLGVGACVSIQFGVVEALKRQFSSSNVASGKSGDLSYGQFYLAGGLAGLANSFVAGPIEHIRIRLQTQPSPPLYRGPIDCVRQIIGKSGVLNGVFRGQFPTFAREFHGMGMYFLTYEALVQYKLASSGLKRDELPGTYAMFAGAMAGYGLWLTAYPADIIKSKLQTDALLSTERRYKGAMDCIQQTFRRDGVKGFFRGLLPTLVRSPFANAATFVAFEWASRNLKHV